MESLKVYKLNDYEWYVTPWNIKKTLEWYNKEFGDDLTEDNVEERDLYNDGIFLLTEDEDDISDLEGKDELISYIKVDGNWKQSPQFGDLIRMDGMVYKYCSLKVAIEELYGDKELTEPEVIASTDF